MTEAFSAWRHLVSLLFEPARALPPKTDARHAEERVGAFWGHVISFANTGFVTAALWTALKRYPEIDATLTEDEREYLAAFHELTQARNRAIRAQTLTCIGLLAAKDIKAMPLKGAAYLIENLGDSLSRFISDIDLLVPADQAPWARDALVEAGYVDAPLLAPVSGAAHHHLTPMVHERLPAPVELHTAVVPEFLDSALTADTIWSRANVVRVNAADIALPDPTDMATISFLHGELVDAGTRSLVIPLRLFHDLHMLHMVHGSAIDWQEIAARARAVNGGTRLRRFLYFYEQLSGQSVYANQTYTLADSASYRIALAAIDHPAIYSWKRRINRLSEPALRRRYKTGSGAIRVNLARCRELASMLGNATRRQE